jgi:chloramphenicol-sensitive protein RarD
LTGQSWWGEARLSSYTGQSARQLWSISFFAAIAISINWLSFVWAVNSGRILDSSLGYYIAPLCSVMLGVAVMKDRLTRLQWSSILIAAAGVLLITATHGSVPWVSIAMALSFAIYGLLKKRAAVPPLIGLLMENVILAFPATIYLLLLNQSGDGSMGRLGTTVDGLIVLGGIITVPPLMLFAIAARRVSLSTIGMLQYIGPTLQFFVGVEVAGESLSSGRLIGFVLVWIGSAIYVYAARVHFRRNQDAASEPLVEQSSRAAI